MPTPELRHVATMTARLGGDSFAIKAPLGRRLIVEVEEVTIEGDRLKAHMVGKSAADWLTVADDFSWGSLDVRFTLETDDGALVYVEYGGRADLAAGKVISAPVFHCGDERYDWLNRTQFVAVGSTDRETNLLTYELYEIGV
ncbi:MAG: DUF3237 domain-containing protein [Actinomycetia bacterium]|nr:DUF3237 domain-containing protein [Actinomycetes bacterium]MCP4958335.1 DUF3237 domain-containing protein [Actinomycetes bacterium]